MTTNNRIVARTETNTLVLTQGNPTTNVDLTLNFIGFGNQQNNSTLRGTLTYREKIALPNNASISVRMFDASVTEANASPIFETTFNSSNRQVPIPFELGYNRNQIDLNRRYVLRAEITIDGRVTWTTDTDYAVLTLGNPTDNVQLNLIQGRQTPAVNPITGQNLSLSKFGTGSIQIGTQNSTFLIRANVNVKTDGSADVTVAGLTGGITFSGKLTSFDQNTLKITVENSGNANASGEIEVRYNGRRLDSITGNNLVLDGQNVTLRF
jgi:putative lipoprotein